MLYLYVLDELRVLRKGELSMSITEIWVDRGNYRNIKVVSKGVSPLADGDILVSIDKYALTSNNVSYAVSGDMIGYWKYFPVDGEKNVDKWGKVTVWGMADVVASSCDGIEVGERLYGFFPMASHAVLTPGVIKRRNFTDVAPHRQPLPGLYNQYMRCQAEPKYLYAIEDERCLFFPLFITSYVINDYLDDKDFFCADQILIGSVSSKTGFGFAHFLKNNERFTGEIIGLTSSGNKTFVEKLNLCDQVVTYGNEARINADVKSVYVDMSGDGPLRRKLHELLGDNMKASILVGATHWEADRKNMLLPGVEAEFFFAPAQIAKRDEDWGAGVLMQKGYSASAELAASLKGSVSIEHYSGVDDARSLWLDMLDNKVSGSRGVMISL